MEDVKGESPPLTNSTLHGGKNNSHVTGISDLKPLNINIPQPGCYSSINSTAAPLKLIPNHHNHSPPSPTGTIRYVNYALNTTTHIYRGEGNMFLYRAPINTYIIFVTVYQTLVLLVLAVIVEEYTIILAILPH